MKRRVLLDRRRWRQTALLRIELAASIGTHDARAADAELACLLDSREVEWRRHIAQRPAPDHGHGLRSPEDVGLERANVRIGIAELLTFDMAEPRAAAHRAEPEPGYFRLRMRAEL